MAHHLIHESARYVDEALWQRAPINNTLHLDNDLAARVASRKCLHIMMIWWATKGSYIAHITAKMVNCFRRLARDVATVLVPQRHEHQDKPDKDGSQRCNVLRY